MHNSHDTNLMEPDKGLPASSKAHNCCSQIQADLATSAQVIMHELHVDDELNLVRYFEKLVRDEVSSSSSSNVSDPNAMQTSQFNTGETFQDRIGFDELMNDFNSTAASAQLLRRSLSGSLVHTPNNFILLCV